MLEYKSNLSYLTTAPNIYNYEALTIDKFLNHYFLLILTYNIPNQI